MKLLKRSLTQPLNNPRTAGVVFFLVIAVLGFADAGFLTVEHYRNIIPPCTTGGCETVLTSPYSIVLGMPVSLLGAIFYLAMAIGASVYLEARLVGGAVRPFHRAVLKWTFLGTVCGLIATLWFLYLQAFVIHAYCQYCLGSAFTSTVLFVTAMIILAKNKTIEDQGTLPPTL